MGGISEMPVAVMQYIESLAYLSLCAADIRICMLALVMG